MRNALVLAMLLIGSYSLFSAHNNLETWDIDKQHTLASFTIGHLGISRVPGLMNIESGELKVDPNAITSAEFEVKMDVQSLTTGVLARDNHVKSKDFLDAEKFPTIKFKSTAVREDKVHNKMLIDGILSIKDKSKAITLIANPISEEVQLDKNGGSKIVRGTVATTTINRFDFGIDYGKSTGDASLLSKIIDGGVGQEIEIFISIELVKKEALAKKTKK